MKKLILIVEDEETKIIPIAMITSLGEVDDRIKALEAGADDFLSKPVDPAELKATVRSLLKVKAYNDHMKNYQNELEKEVARRTEQLKKAHYKIRKASLETIHRLARASEYKDDDTGIDEILTIKKKHKDEPVSLFVNMLNQLKNKDMYV